MLRILSIFAAGAVALSLSSCLDVVNVNIPEGKPQLAVEGAITDQPGPYTVKLTQTVPYFDGQPAPAVRGATLELSDDLGRREILREETPGVYVSTGTVQGRIGGQYRLRIQADGEQYEAATEIKRTPEIDSLGVEFKANSSTNDEGNYILYYGPELEGVGDYYRFKVYENGQLLNQPGDIIISSDELVDGNYIGAVELSGPFQQGDNIRVELNAIPRDYYYFLNELATQINNVGLFASPPANVRTNVRNLNPASGKQAVGYFAGYPVRADSVLIR